MKIASGIFGLSGVALGALGAHALAARLAATGKASVWETAAQYQLLHAVALLAVAVALMSGAARERPGVTRWLTRAGWCWSAGVVLFSGSLYWVALGGPRWLWPFAPAGGLALMAGWLCVCAAAGARRKNEYQ